MKLKEVLELITKLHEDKGTSVPWICGGVVRDKILGKLDKLTDIDITTGDNTVNNLAKELILFLSKKYQITSKTADDNHISVFLGKLKLDFSSNFIVPNIQKYIDIENPTDIEKETFSRDFTCNSLLMSLDLKDIQDPTGKGIEDIKNKIIKTCLDPEVTFKYNTNRISRVFYLASKLDFDVDESIIEWIKANPDYIRKSKDAYISKNINKALEYNPEKLALLLNKTKLWNYIPVTENLLPFYKKSITKSAQFFKNFDYADSPSGPGTNVFQNMDKYKSIDEFRKKRKKKQKQLRKKIIDTRPK